MTHTTSLANNFEFRICRGMDPGLVSGRTSCHVFAGISASLFAASAALTVAWCTSMSGMRGMAMPGGWTMSMAWMRMPGQTWPEAAVSFLGMWVVMMVAMMLPSVAPALWRYRHVLGSTGELRKALLTVLAGVGYFFVWALLGSAVYPLGVALAVVEMQQLALARVAPIAVGGVVLIAGTIQFTSFKAHQLACCRDTPGGGGALPADTGTALRFGLDLGLHCSYCSANLTAVLLAIGVMDVRVMALMTAAMTAERVAPAGGRVAHVIGTFLVAAGLFLIARASGIQ